LVMLPNRATTSKVNTDLSGGKFIVGSRFMKRLFHCPRLLHCDVKKFQCFFKETLSAYPRMPVRIYALAVTN